MTDTVITRPPLGIRLMGSLRKEPDWTAMPPAALDAFRASENRKRSSALARLITGFPDRGADIAWRNLELPDRRIRVRVYRAASAQGELPLVLHVHGGGFVGTAVQCDWINSYLATRLPAVVVSVEHRLVAAGTPLSAAVDDGWDTLRHVVQDAASWGIDPARVAVFGESAGATIAALTAIRVRNASLPLRAQVLVNPCTDLTSTAFDYPSMREHATSPTLTVTQMEFFRRLAVPDGSDARAVSPLYADDLSDLAPALVVVPAVDPVADQGRAYATRLRAAGTPADLTEHPGAPHAFLSMPGIVRQARAAREEVIGFLRERLAA
ncbi:alpha/beta hydrolase [Actinoplanes lobatus]|uniref:Acetyl esterase n=1 Tax=Actinoplanes lobatus TaxID=113568 RepID=A0A7W7HLM4_9ACTN|nr:alpha/beta hydrolase [Actinoplanes lobatus]MBB4752825.1 acetyl esterase [Actinoplanes lobatus]GGN88442.1 alpha/beta hydrolase [Actinoplanes lobatus]GIE39435.1 alpha/beta hydrolase [Actinoplanes lobatus]